MMCIIRLAGTYHVGNPAPRATSGDRYSSGWNADKWERAGIKCVPSERPKSALYLAALPMLLSGQVRLLDNAKLRQ